MEILAGGLENFFHNEELGLTAELSYKGKRYEVWNVTDETFRRMCDMSEDTFAKYAGEDAWWRSSNGSVLDYYDQREFTVKGQKMIGFHRSDKDEYCNHTYLSFTEYSCEYIGASTEKNIIAVAMDVARMNGLTVGELFTKYEG